jgi:hypothetical protein
MSNIPVDVFDSEDETTHELLVRSITAQEESLKYLKTIAIILDEIAETHLLSEEV